ncbi:winged helix-turn-helix domain-containing protein [Paenibacillus spongiae]|uniref:Response regulator transcription factor n=1 Tax=Paenibacillus spongiae TaxID=2909671 RepID=A0ABY5SHT7_9BACL|nr:response regulator transcription factor [Paenibacillus spongiae]UVI32245.1 response regulator transcription factor [Paenibacillus spongiae]
MNIVWVEDEEKLLAECIAFFEQVGYRVYGVSTYEEAVDCIERALPDLLIVDWMLPGGGSGIDLCKRNERQWNLPIIMVTAKGDEFDKVLALELGADDYVSKPFGLRELAARIKAVMRRSRRPVPGLESSEAAEGVIYRGDLVIDSNKYTVSRDSLKVDLTRTEFMLLQKLASHPGRVYTRMQLMDEALGDAYVGFERTMDSHIRNLRRKLEPIPAEPRYVLTVYGVGYAFNEEV